MIGGGASGWGGEREVEAFTFIANDRFMEMRVDSLMFTGRPRDACICCVRANYFSDFLIFEFNYLHFCVRGETTCWNYLSYFFGNLKKTTFELFLNSQL